MPIEFLPHHSRNFPLLVFSNLTDIAHMQTVAQPAPKILNHIKGHTKPNPI